MTLPSPQDTELPLIICHDAAPAGFAIGKKPHTDYPARHDASEQALADLRQNQVLQFFTSLTEFVSRR